MPRVDGERLHELILRTDPIPLPELEFGSERMCFGQLRRVFQRLRGQSLRLLELVLHKRNDSGADTRQRVVRLHGQRLVEAGTRLA